jgi:hypothetical protein
MGSVEGGVGIALAGLAASGGKWVSWFSKLL